MTYITLAALILLAASAIFAQYRQLQVLQQNLYSATRYFKWIKQSFALELAISAILYCALTILFSGGKALLVLIVAVLMLVVRIVTAVKAHKTSTKKLEFTTRVKCLYITSIILLVILLVVCALTGSAMVTGIKQLGKSNIFFASDAAVIINKIALTLCVLLSTVEPLLTFVIWAVTFPIEKIVAKRHINDANEDFDSDCDA